MNIPEEPTIANHQEETQHSEQGNEGEEQPAFNVNPLYVNDTSVQTTTKRPTTTTDAVTKKVRIPSVYSVIIRPKSSVCSQGAPLKSSENQTQKTRSELAIAEEKGKSGGEARRRKRGGEKRRKGRKKEDKGSRAFSSALSPPLFPFSSAIANSLLVFCVWFSLLFKGAPCGLLCKKESKSNDSSIHFEQFSNVQNSDGIYNATQSSFFEFYSIEFRTLLN